MAFAYWERFLTRRGKSTAVPRFLLVVQSAVYGQGVLLATGRLFTVETAVKIDKERAELLKLIDDAQALASIGKTSDAVTKLRNFTVKVDQLEAAAPAPRVPTCCAPTRRLPLPVLRVRPLLRR